MQRLFIAFAPGPLPAFTDPGRRGYWTRYDMVDADGLTQLDCVVEINVAPNHGTGDTRADVYVVLRDFPTDRYGLVYGDDTFEAALDAWLCRRLGLGTESQVFTYSEQGMQPQDGAHLEVGRGNTARLTALSAHDLHRLTNDPAVFVMARDDVSLVDRAAPDWMT